ncbi:MAG: TIGR02452 family protein [Promethearchaeota archaeon]
MKKLRINVQRETLAYLERNKPKFKLSKVRKYDDVQYDSSWKTFEAQTIQVVPMDTLEAVIYFQEIFQKKFGFLVMANAYNPGGGYKTGAPAQEESICRRTNLVPCINRVTYPISEFGCVYVKNIYIIRNLEEKDYQFFKKPYISNCLLSAAYNNPPIDRNSKLLPKYREGTVKKIQNMLNCFLENGDTNIILGAFGCGAFSNPPEEIATLFLEILQSKRYRNKFENSIFAIIDKAWHNNYNIFKKIIG